MGPRLWNGAWNGAARHPAEGIRGTRPRLRRVAARPARTSTGASAGAPCSRGCACGSATARAADQLIQLTEGVIVAERLGPPVEIEPTGREAVGDRRRRGTCGVEADLLSPGHLRITVEPADEVAADRRELAARRTPSTSTGGGCRHGLRFDQAGRLIDLGADRRYTGPDCPPDMTRGGRRADGRLRAGALAALLGRMGGLGRVRRARRPVRPAGRRLALDPRRLRPAAPAPPARAGPAALPAPLLRADRLPSAACPSGPMGTGRAATSTSTSATCSRTSTATASTTCRSTRS